MVIIQKALGRENIDEVIKLSEDYKASESMFYMRQSFLYIYCLVRTIPENASNLTCENRS